MTDDKIKVPDFLIHRLIPERVWAGGAFCIQEAVKIAREGVLAENDPIIQWEIWDRGKGRTVYSVNVKQNRTLEEHFGPGVRRQLEQVAA